MIQDNAEPLEVVTYPDEPTFSTFTGAIDAVSRTDRYKAAKRDTALIKGSEIVAVEYHDEWVRFALSCQQSLIISLDGGTVVWKVEPVDIVTHPGDEQESLGPLVILKYTHLSEPYIWKRKDILDNLVGRRFLMLSPSIAWAFLSVENVPEIIFMRVSIAGKDVLRFDYV
ncbi:MAG: hypothetical protein ABFC63_00010 [Thermoguttaceae bacterium]